MAGKPVPDPSSRRRERKEGAGTLPSSQPEWRQTLIPDREKQGLAMAIRAILLSCPAHFGAPSLARRKRNSCGTLSFRLFRARTERILAAAGVGLQSCLMCLTGDFGASKVFKQISLIEFMFRNAITQLRPFRGSVIWK